MYVITRYAHAKNNLKMILGCELGDNFFKKTCSLINPYNKAPRSIFIEKKMMFYIIQRHFLPLGKYMNSTIDHLFH